MTFHRRSNEVEIHERRPRKKSPHSVDSSSKQNWRRFMNERVTDRAYVPTAPEHAANCLTHGCLIVPSIIGAQRLILKSRNSAQFWSSWIYGTALVFLFSCSTVFHCTCFHPTYRNSIIKEIFHRLDRAIIYIFISSSYTPWLILRSSKTFPTSFTVSLVWIMSIFGIIFQLLYHERNKFLETCCYVVVGVFPALVIIDMTNHEGIIELALGGFIFLFGIFFFKCDGIIPFAHAIWHCFVFLGASVHYYAVDSYLIG